MAEPSIYWPPGLPQSPSRSSYTRATGNNAVRTAMEFGPVKTRRRSSAQPSALTATYLLKGKQKDIFLQFYEIVDCHASFWLPNPEDLSQYILVKIRASGDDQGVTLSLLAPGVWSMPLTLEVHPHVPAQVRMAGEEEEDPTVALKARIRELEAQVVDLKKEASELQKAHELELSGIAANLAAVLRG